VKCRQLRFYVEQAELGAMMDAVRDRVIPRYEAVPHFLGLTVVKRDSGKRSEVTVASFWDEGLEGSEVACARSVKEIAETTGSNPIRTGYDTLYASVRDSTQAFGVAGMHWEGRPRNRPTAGETGERAEGALDGSGSAA
jgi:hypothetical protein